MPSITLVVPPQIDPTAPDLSLVLLGARVLAAGGKIFDANRYALMRFLSTDHAEQRRTLLEAAVAETETADRLEDCELAYAYFRLIGSRLLRNGPDREAARRMLAELSDPTVGAELQTRLRREVERRLDIAVAPYHGQLRLNDLTAVHATDRSVDLMSAAADPTFPYASFWSDSLQSLGPGSDDIWCLWIEADQQLLPTTVLLEHLCAQKAAGATSPKLIATGPMADVLEAALRSGALSNPGVDVVTSVDDASPRLHLPEAQDTSLAEHEAALDALHVATGAASLRLTSQADPAVLADQLRIADIPKRARQIILTEPRSPEQLAVLARAWEGQEVNWTPTLRFGHQLESEIAEQLYRGGVRSVTFEVKGFAGWPTEDAARDGLSSSWEAARFAGLRVALNIVFGYPTDSVASFRRFTAFVAEQRCHIDRVLRFKLYRVLLGSPAHTDPQSLGITEFIQPPPEADLARTLAFRTATGLDSASFFSIAHELVGLLKHDPADLQPSTLHVDDAGCNLATPSPVTPPQSRQSRSADQPRTIVQAANLVLVPCRFDYRKLDALYADYRPRPDSPPPKPNLDAAPCVVAYHPAAGRIVALSEFLAGLLRKAAAPVSVIELLEDYPLPIKPKIDKAIGQLLKNGLIQPVRR